MNRSALEPDPPESAPAKAALETAWPKRAQAAAWVSLALGVCVFALVVLGGKVTSYDAGMAVPDWPGTFGRQMFLAPFNEWAYDPATGKFLQGPFLEHSHRLLGSAAGLLSIAQVVLVWRLRPARPALRWASVFLLGLIIVQGLMGGFRVSEQSVFLAGVHGVVGQLVLALAVVMAAASSKRFLALRLGQTVRKARGGAVELWILTGVMLAAFAAAVVIGRNDGEAELIQWRLSAVGWACAIGVGSWLVWSAWRMAQNLRATPALARSAPGRSAATWSMVLIGAVVLQLILGAAVRHGQAERAIPDAPLVLGSALPPTSETARSQALAGMDDKLIARAQTQPELWKVWLHYTHRVGAVVVCAVVLLAAGAVGRCVAMDRRAKRWAGLALLLVGVQVALGLMTVWSNIHPLLASGHQAVGAGLMATTAAMGWSVWRSRRVYTAQALSVESASTEHATEAGAVPVSVPVSVPAPATRPAAPQGAPLPTERATLETGARPAPQAETVLEEVRT
ncbi:MAG: COX15/CtaA family protein [Planctomycetota bacterium]